MSNAQAPWFAAPGAEILDACCGGRMWWWDKAHPLAVYMDVHRAAKGSAAKFDGGKRHASPGWSCEPDVIASFTAMPFADESFQMVVFDPPHNVRPGGPLGVNGLMYGALHPDTEQDDLRRGFAECWRVLAPGGTLIFKWAGDIKRVKPHFPATPIVGTRVPRGLQTWWLTFYKPLAAAIQLAGINGGDRGDSRSPLASSEIGTDALPGPVAPQDSRAAHSQPSSEDARG